MRQSTRKLWGTFGFIGLIVIYPARGGGALRQLDRDAAMVGEPPGRHRRGGDLALSGDAAHRLDVAAGLTLSR